MAANRQQKQELIFLLLGKTGSGKSAVGNSIVAKKEFKSSADAKSVTSSIRPGYTQTDRYNLMVIDGPGLGDTDLEDLEDKERTCRNLDIALSMTENGVHVFVLVIKYGVRFTKEERSVISALRKILGPNWLSHHSVIVMTCGNNWHNDMKDEGKNITFIEWCKETNVLYDGLFAACDYRCVLFENSRPDEKQKQQQFHEITYFAEEVKEKYGRYTNEHFRVAVASRDELIVQLKAPLLKADIQKSISLLEDECMKLSDEQSYGEKMKSVGAIIGKSDALLQHIDKEDKGTGVLSDLQQTVLKIKEQTQHMQQDIQQRSAEAVKSRIALIKQSAMQIEATRKDSSLWNKITRALKCLALGAAGASFASMAVVTGGVAPAAGLVLGAACETMGLVGAGAALVTDDKTSTRLRIMASPGADADLATDADSSTKLQK